MTIIYSGKLPPTCAKHGVVMIERSREVRLPKSNAVGLIPTGEFFCIKCEHEEKLRGEPHEPRQDL